MNQYQMSHGYRRQTSCQMPCSVPYSTPSNSDYSNNMKRNMEQRSDMNYRSDMCERKKNTSECSSSILEHADFLPLAMAYVPCQKFTETFDICNALRMGTIFPDLCKPFCGKRGCMR